MLKKIGIILIVVGGLLLFLESLNNIPSALRWIFNWGESASWGIRIGILGLGGVCCFWSSFSQKQDEVEEE